MKPYTLAFIDIKGKAGQVKEEWRWRVGSRIEPLCAFDGPKNDRYYSLEYLGSDALGKREYDIVAHPGLVWDYASGWFDYDAMKEASLGHDIYHFLIAKGIIDASYNDAIDNEFYRILRSCGVPHWRAKWLRRGTNTCDEVTDGEDRTVIYLNHGERL